MQVWKELLWIPYGTTRTYGEIARRIGNPGAARAVGMACHQNPVGIIVPCHRVIGTNGGLTGYAGGLETKKKLLELEHRYRSMTRGVCAV
jgi:methylated-DNA-[protein]-cysteine S-methyltransferase